MEVEQGVRGSTPKTCCRPTISAIGAARRRISRWTEAQPLPPALVWMTARSNRGTSSHLRSVQLLRVLPLVNLHSEHARHQAVVEPTMLTVLRSAFDAELDGRLGEQGVIAARPTR